MSSELPPSLMVLCPTCGQAVEVLERMTAASPPMLYDRHYRRGWFVIATGCLKMERKLCQGSYRKVSELTHRIYDT